MEISEKTSWAVSGRDPGWAVSPPALWWGSPTPVSWHGCPGQPTASLLQTEKPEHVLPHCPSAASRPERAESEPRTQGGLFRKMCFPVSSGSLVISILIFNMHVEARTNVTSWMTNFKQWRLSPPLWLRHLPLTDTGGKGTHEHLRGGGQFSKATSGLYLTFRLGVGQLIEAETWTRLDLAQGKVGLETVCPPFWVRTKVDTLTQDWWLLWELALLLTVRMIVSFSQQWPWHRIHHSWGKGQKPGWNDLLKVTNWVRGLRRMKTCSL